MEDDMLMHEMWTHYNSDDDTKDDEGGTTADGNEAEQQHQQEIARKHGISRLTLDRIWKDSVPLQLRTSIRAFAGYLKGLPSTVYRLLKGGKLRSHACSTHPKLTEDHKIQRMKWVLQHILPATRTQPPKFVDMQNVAHIDEKWFYLSPDMRRFYLFPIEDDPYICCQSKRFKIKAMFMCATSRLIKDSEGRMIHDGKFGMYPFVEYARTKYSTKNKRAGTLLTKAIDSVTLAVMRDMIVNTIIPIMRNWPEGVSKYIYIQQDNARPHIHASDP
ncbi:uncharacterized protein LOC104901081 [Beta vulgaris subsp. vulgaris]|uniref:uncharacterized protein LOC104901081 n=1 Tax=Beta vulgaris subsp. vulgaris TaxID=3555 RepID=UPI0020370A9F|nr:uncharacterized protein LOC104901081 [Beta vulgaris subsp. vulgaris]